MPRSESKKTDEKGKLGKMGLCGIYEKRRQIGPKGPPCAQETCSNQWPSPRALYMILALKGALKHKTIDPVRIKFTMSDKNPQITMI